MTHTPLSRSVRSALKNAINTRGYRRVYADTGVAPRTLKRALDGLPVAPAVHTRLSRVPQKVRTRESFAEYVERRAPRRASGAYAWDLATIRSARDCQLVGSFATPVALATAFRTDDALFAAYQNRIAPQISLATVLKAHDSARGKAVHARVSQLATAPRTVLQGIHGTLANHGVAVGFVEREVNDDGTAVSMRLTEWPLEHVRYDSTRELLITTVRDEISPVEIVHGDGTWIVFRKCGVQPWTQDACVLPGALIWAAHALGLSDWNAATRAHGLARVMGELPEGVALKNEDGALSPEAQAFLDLLVDVISGEAPAGIRPAGSKTEFVSNQSGAWQVFETLVTGREKASQRIYNGTDAALGSVGGAPGVDISQLFGIATTRLQGDLQAIEDGLNVGLYEPCTAINCGDTRYTPRFRYLLPDPDEDAKRKENAERRARLHDTLKRMREEKLMVTQEIVDALAAELGVSPAPLLAAVEDQTSSLVLAPTDVARVVRVREARLAQGLPPFSTPERPDPRDDMTIEELTAWTAAKAAAAAAPPAPPAPEDAA